MKIALVQTRPFRGDVNRNIVSHKQFVHRAVAPGADAIFFPELSLTGYEPQLAKELATNTDHPLFNDFQHLSDTHNLLIGAGMPTKGETGIHITMLIFQPHLPRQAYSKQYLHADEDPFFIPGNKPGFLQMNDQKIALAICYEISVPEHAATAGKNAANIYLASVAKTVSGVEKSLKQLSGIAAMYNMTTLMVNAVGESGDGLCTGKSSAWNKKGELIGQLDDTREGLLIVDLETNATEIVY